MRRNPHNKETPKASDIIEVIHLDIMGSVNKSINDYRFILVIIDEYSRKSWIFLLKRKSKAIDVVVNTLKFLNFPNKNSIKIFKSDYGKEFDNIRIKKILQRKRYQ